MHVCLFYLKGQFTQKVIIYITLLLFQTCKSFFVLLNPKKLFWRMCVTKQLKSSYKHILTILVTITYLVTNILQNSFFCVQQNTKTLTGLKQVTGE